MTVQWRGELLNEYVAPDIYEFTSAEIPDLAAHAQESSSWMADHFLNAVLRGAFKLPIRTLAMSCIYRAQTAIAAYQMGAALTAEYLDGATPGSPRIRLYFRALAQWEACLLNWQILVEVYNELSPERAFTKGDGSKDERAYEMANAIKLAGASPPAAAPPTVPVWLTNAGISCHSHHLTYEELASLLREATAYAKVLVDPKTAAGR